MCMLNCSSSRLESSWWILSQNWVLGQAILAELSSSMEVLHPEAEHRQKLNDYTWKRRVIKWALFYLYN